LRSKYVDVVDADLSKYFDTIPHEELMRSVERRIADGKVLWQIRAWLKVPVHETHERGKTVISGGKKTKAGTPQGGVISPLLANIYFRRFLVAWEQFGFDRKYESRIVNYADDFVILTRKHAREALRAARRLLAGLKLTLNETKTRAVRAWQESFTFLGFTFGKLHTRDGREYLGGTPSAKNVRKFRETVREITATRETRRSAASVAEALNHQTRGFWNYFHRGTVSELIHDLDQYLWDRMGIWAKRKYRPPRQRSPQRASGAKTRWAKVRAARKLLVRGRDLNLLRDRNGGPLFAPAAPLLDFIPAVRVVGFAVADC
jgi:RNA-directed DNA polymerase